MCSYKRVSAVERKLGSIQGWSSNGDGADMCGWILEAIPGTSWSRLLQHNSNSPAWVFGSYLKGSSCGLCWAVQCNSCPPDRDQHKVLQQHLDSLGVHVQGYYFLEFISCSDPGQIIFTVCLSADLKCSSWSLHVMQRSTSSPPCHSFQLHSTSQVF